MPKVCCNECGIITAVKMFHKQQ